MKKITYLLLSALVTFSAIGLCACGGNGDENKTTEPTTKKEEISTTAKNEEESSSEDTSKVKYTVKVVDEEGNPVVGAMVQLCKDSCVPAMTKDNGVAEFELAEDNYDVKFAVFPKGYEYSTDEQVFHFESGKTELTITLKKVAE